jgi:hypothetical protein
MELQSSEEGHFVPVGCHGFYRHGAVRARFDQQPLEAYATAAACLDAQHATGDPAWGAHAQMAFDWFLGVNDVGVPLIDPTTGTCYDGLQPGGVNQNQGAESMLAFLLARLHLRMAEAATTAAEAAQEAARVLTDRSTERPIDRSTDRSAAGALT